MIFLRDAQVQTDVISVLRQALSGVPVGIDTKTPPDGRFIRVDGFGPSDNEIYKNADATTHFFFVHAFDAPPGGTNSLKWVREKLALADAAIMQATLAGGQARRQEAQVLFEPSTAEGVFDAHGFIRYRVQIGA